MNVIFDLIFKYLKLNKKRTLTAFFSVVISVFFFAIVSNVSVWTFNYMKGMEIHTYGAWQVRFDELDKVQAEKLRERSEFKSCVINEKADGTWAADVELKKVNKKMFALTQEIGKEIGMTPAKELGIIQELPDGNQAQYSVSYHMGLLDFYGIKGVHDENMSIKYILLLVLGIIMGIFALLIYSIFSLSFMEKRRYIGLLDCVGASRWQRKLFIFGEGIVTGAVSIPVGLLLGSVGGVFAVDRCSRVIEGTYDLHIEGLDKLDVRVLVIAAIMGIMTIAVAALVPTLRAGKVSALELMTNAQGQERMSDENSRMNTRYSMEFNMAVRNLACSKRKNLKIVFFAVLTIVVTFNGFIQIKSMNGDYVLRDHREFAPLDAWLNLYSDDFTLEEKVEKQLESLPSVQKSEYVSVLDLGGIVIDKKYLSEGLDEFELCSRSAENPMYYNDERDGAEKNKYAFYAKVIGLDDDTFAAYARQCSAEMPDLEKQTYPVIIENYIPIEKPGEKAGKYREVLSIPKDEDVNILYGVYADFFLSMKDIYRSETEELAFRVLSTTAEHSPLPPMAYEFAFDTGTLSQYETTSLKIYMPHSVFQRFLKDERVVNTYGKLKEYDNPAVTTEVNPILNYMYVERNKEYAEKEIKEGITGVMEQTGLADYNSGLSSFYINDSNSWQYRTTEGMQRQKLLEQISEVLKRVFIIGGILLIAFFTLLSLMNYILTSIYVRRRELSVLKSLGMGYRQLKRMLLYETGILIIISGAVGAVIGFSIAIVQFREIKEGSATVAVNFPYQFFIGEIAVVLLLAWLVALFAVRKVKGVNMIDALKSENE